MPSVPDVIMDHAHAEGLRHFFGLPSSGVLLHLLDSGRRKGVEFVASASESSGAISAAYYGYFKGCAGMALAIQGTGAGNMLSGAVNISFERKPVVCISECPADDDFGDWGQQGDHPAMFQSTAKCCLRVSEHNASQVIYDAFKSAGEPRLGPVLVELPRNLGNANTTADVIVPPRISPQPPSQGKMQEACDLLSSFQKPVIIAGDDVRREGVSKELHALANSRQAAVLLTMDGRGILSEKDPRFGCVYTGTAPPHTLFRSFLQEADGVLVVGADGRMKEAQWDIDLPVCELLTDRVFPALSGSPQLRLDGLLRPTIEKLLAIGNSTGFSESRIAELRASVQSRFNRPASAQFTANDVIEITREQLPAEGLLFAETGVIQTMLEKLWPVTTPNTFFGSTVGRTMGLTIPALLGARLARPHHPMVGFTTDGSALMRLGDLECYARVGAAVPLVILNDGCLGTIRAQQKFKSIPNYGLDLRMVDFAQIACAVGLQGVTVNTPEEFRAALKKAWTSETATVIDARVDPQAYQDSMMPMTGMTP